MDLRKRHSERIAPATAKHEPTTGDDGKIHPRAIFDAIAAVADPDYIAIADGGDLLSFARTGLAGAQLTWTPAPSAVSASACRLQLPRHSRCPDRQVISVNGDGAFGINAMEIDTAVRHGAKARIHRVEQCGLEHRAARPGDELRRPRRRHDAAPFRLRGDGAGARVARRARREAGGTAERAARGRSRTRRRWSMSSPRRRSFRRTRKKGLGFVPDFQALTAWDEAERKRRQTS